MKIDTNKIEEIIKQSVSSVTNFTSPWVREDVCIGELDGVQIQIVVTSDEDDFIEEASLNDLAVTSE